MHVAARRGDFAPMMGPMQMHAHYSTYGILDQFAPIMGPMQIHARTGDVDLIY
jgi:hypothetical protein